MHLRILFTVLIVVVFLVQGCSGFESAGVDNSQISDSSGIVLFRDAGSGEEVSVRVVDQENEPAEGIQVDFVDGNGFEAFVAFDPHGEMPPSLSIFPHNSTHTIQMAAEDAFPVILELLPGSEQYEAVMLFADFLDDFAEQGEAPTNGPEVPANWLYRGISTPEELEQENKLFLMLLKATPLASFIKITEYGGKLLDILYAMGVVEEPDAYHSWVIVPSLGDSENLAGSIFMVSPIYEEQNTDIGTCNNEDALDVSAVLPAGMEFVTIPSGSFMMGSPESEDGRTDYEGPRHSVSISSFEMMSTEVTQGMWEEVMGSNPSDFTGDLNRPVENVSWNDCQDFIEKLNDLDPSHTYRLPSESEWECACRAGATDRFYWGEDSVETVINDYAWWRDSGDTTYPVATKRPNSWGLYDMSGNVYEWCEDSWHNSYNGAPTDGSAWISLGASSRMSRGGGWSSYARRCRSADRSSDSADRSGSTLGFRLARSVR